MSSDLNMHVCNMSVSGIHMSVHGTSLFVTFKMLFLSLLQEISTVNSPVTPSDKFLIAIYSAYRQESANRYIHALEQSVTVKNGSVHMVSFPVTFLPKYV